MCCGGVRGRPSKSTAAPFDLGKSPNIRRYGERELMHTRCPIDSHRGSDASHRQPLEFASDGRAWGH